MKKLLSALLALLLSFSALAEHMGAPYEFRNSSVTDARIASGVTEIAEGAYYYCKELQTLDVPATVTKIGDYAFDHCENLTELTVPNSVREIGECAFNYCMRIASLDLGNGVKTLGNYAFSCCFSLRQATIPQSMTSIGDYAFYNCRALDTLYIYSSVQTIGVSALEGCPRLTVYTPATSSAAAYCTQNGIKWVAIEEPEATGKRVEQPKSEKTPANTIESCAHIWSTQPTSIVSATAAHPSHTVRCIHCDTTKDMHFDANCTECNAKEALWYWELTQLAYDTDRYSEKHAALPENSVRIDVQRKEANIDKNEIVTPDCLIYTTVNSSGILSVAFAFEGSQGEPYQLLYDGDDDPISAEGWNDWWLTDYAVGKDERGIHRGFDECIDAFIKYLEENICIPIPDFFEDQFSKDDLARNADGQLCVSWEGFLNYAFIHLTQTEIRITGHSLGGALAQVFTYNLLNNHPFTKYQITTVTFASPVPFSDESIASTLYDNLKVFNYINVRDFVPKYGVTDNTDRFLSLFETSWNEISNTAGFTASGFPGGFVAAGSNLGYNIYLQGDAQPIINVDVDLENSSVHFDFGLIIEHVPATYTQLLNGFFNGTEDTEEVLCYVIDTRDSAFWDSVWYKYWIQTSAQ